MIPAPWILKQKVCRACFCTLLIVSKNRLGNLVDGQDFYMLMSFTRPDLNDDSCCARYLQTDADFAQSSDEVYLFLECAGFCEFSDIHSDSCSSRGL